MYYHYVNKWDTKNRPLCPKVEVELKLKSDAMSFLGSGGMAIVVGEVAVYH